MQSTPSSIQSPVSSDVMKQSYKMKKEKYHSEKRRVAKELLSTLKDPTVVVMADWLKIRGTLRTWTKMYCVLKPGLLLIYKGPKTHKYGYWIGTVLLSTIELIERPSKRDGFCFKLFHPLDQSIWATRGPQGENFGAVTQPLPSSYLICRAPCEEAGRCWMDGLELALKCSSLLIRTMSKLQETTLHSSSHILPTTDNHNQQQQSGSYCNGASSTSNLKSVLSQDDMSDSHSLLDNDVNKPISDVEAEKHFSEAGLGDENLTESENEDIATKMESDIFEDETHYEASPPEVFGALGDSEQTEEVAEENKSLIWSLMKQVRPGMDLSKVVLPTFILEPRSFLEKLADYYYHADLLKEAVNEDDPFRRMKAVVKFYMSGFYKKPKGLKKPYNPILGEKFRCYWQHNDQSRTFYVAEQVSHHPPVAAFFASNRQAGFNVAGSILAKSKFYGNSLSAIMVGTARITLLNRGESYVVTLPYAHCKGLILGTLTMELGGSVKIVCDRTSYTAELDFKLKPFLGGPEAMNACSGKIKLGKETLADLTGHWDSTIYLTDRQTSETEIFWQPNQDSIARRLKRFEVPLSLQEETESQRLWAKVSDAIKNNDQIAATAEKTVIEQAQRHRVKQRLESGDVHKPLLFELDHNTASWMYKSADYRPWDVQNDLHQYEGHFIIRTRVRHPTPLVRTSSGGVSGEAAIVGSLAVIEGSSDEERALGPTKRKKHKIGPIELVVARQMEESMRPFKDDLTELRSKVNGVMFKIDRLSHVISQSTESLRTQMLIILAVLVAFQAIVSLFFGSKVNTH